MVLNCCTQLQLWSQCHSFIECPKSYCDHNCGHFGFIYLQFFTISSIATATRLQFKTLDITNAFQTILIVCFFYEKQFQISHVYTRVLNSYRQIPNTYLVLVSPKRKMIFVYLCAIIHLEGDRNIREINNIYDK